MSGDIYIPPATVQKLAENFPKGTRHKAKMDIAVSLIGSGMSRAAVISELASKFNEASEKEIADVVDYAIGINPTPPVGRSSSFTYSRPQFRPMVEEKKRTPFEHATWWLSGETIKIDAFKELSQLPINPDRTIALKDALEYLYDGPESLNIICKYSVDEKSGRVTPIGGGQTSSRDEWIEYINESGIPESKAGAWIRPNPCTAIGSGKDLAITDSDIVSWRFLLLESDELPIEVQFALYSKLKLPISAVVMSGGKSVHAWVRIAATSGEAYRNMGEKILAALKPFGIDQANKNASRLSRLPSAKREIKATGDGIQWLLWLNPAKQPITEKGFQDFETSLEIPAIEDAPFQSVILDSIGRYDDLMQNRGKLGVPTGFEEFDRDSGGLQSGQMSILAGETNSGKSSIAVNIINSALLKGVGVALFSLEMTKEEIADLIFAINCKVDRNHFNTGDFDEDEAKRIQESVPTLANLPLWVYDESMLTANQIRKRILALKSQDKIKLAVVDYTQIVNPEAGDNREQQVALIARTLCATAKDAKIALVLLSQLNDEGKVRESRVVAHEAHNVFLIENHEDEGKIILKVKKGRRIRKKDYELQYKMEYCQITNRSFRPQVSGDYRQNGKRTPYQQDQ